MLEIYRRYSGGNDSSGNSFTITVLGKIYWAIEFDIGIGRNAIIGAFVGMCSRAVDGIVLAALFFLPLVSKNGLSCNRTQFDGPSAWFVYCILVSWVKPARPSRSSPLLHFLFCYLSGNPMWEAFFFSIILLFIWPFCVFLFFTVKASGSAPIFRFGSALSDRITSECWVFLTSFYNLTIFGLLGHTKAPRKC